MNEKLVILTLEEDVCDVYRVSNYAFEEIKTSLEEDDDIDMTVAMVQMEIDSEDVLAEEVTDEEALEIVRDMKAEYITVKGY